MDTCCISPAGHGKGEGDLLWNGPPNNMFDFLQAEPDSFSASQFIIPLRYCFFS